MLDVVGKRLVRRRGRDDSPDAAVDDDRGAGDPVEAGLTCSGRERSRQAGVILDPRRATGAEYLRGHRGTVERPAGARLDGVLTVLPHGDDGHRRAVLLEPGDGGVREVEHLGDLLRDGREHLRRRRASSDEGRDTPKRCLLLCKLLDPVAIPHVRLRHGDHRASIRADRRADASVALTVPTASASAGRRRPTGRPLA
jgi:hypothetical protein